MTTQRIKPIPKRKCFLKRNQAPRRESVKHRRLSRQRTNCNRHVRERSEGLCEIRIAGVCLGVAATVHEPLTRARAITDPTKCLNACAACHEWIHDHPRQATELGFLTPSHEGKLQ